MDDKYLKDLPQEIRYLLIPAKELIKLSAEELAELAECDILIQAVQRKVKDLSSERVKIILTEHYERLGQWLEDHAQEEIPAEWNYILEFLYNASIHADMIFDFEQEDEIPPPPGRLAMKIPQAFKADQQEHEIRITDGETKIFVNHIDEESYEYLKQSLNYTFRSSEQEAPGGYSARSIALENSRGRKYNQEETDDELQKMAYLLEVPNGFVYIDIESPELFEENLYEEMIGSIQIELGSKKDHEE